MLAKTFTATIIGLDAIKIEVEVDGNRGTPGLHFIGLPSKATDEARERITATLQNCNIRVRSKRTIVNLAPADIPKTGSTFDLAIVVGMLKMYDEIQVNTDSTMFFGELSLDGSIKKIRGVLPLVLAARAMGYKKVVIPADNSDEVSIISGIAIHPLRHLNEYVTWCLQGTPLPTLTPQPFTASVLHSVDVDFAYIHGQEAAKRALIIAAAGGHNVLLNGSPGAGKSMMAKALVSILPPLTEAEAIEVTRIYSICGLTPNGLIKHRPFRSPHHSTSQVGLIGGGTPLKPGEISLAHRGVLFLDELAEFPKTTIEALRQPLEDRYISISRAAGSTEYPASFTLVGATNPCPCGYRYSTVKHCKCSPYTLELYDKKLSGPMRDRFDLTVPVREVDMETLEEANTLSPVSASIRTQIIKARTLQAQRFAHHKILTNAEMQSIDVHRFCTLTQEARFLLQRVNEKRSLSARGYFKMIKVAQTISDLANSPVIERIHMAEALGYRN